MSGSAPQPDTVGAPATLAALRDELRRVRAGLARIEEGLDALERDERPAPTSERPRAERYLKLLVDVYEHGGRHGVDSDAFGALGARYGYDRRGLGGFFRGARAPLRLTDGRVRLTVEGERLVDEFLAGLAS